MNIRLLLAEHHPVLRRSIRTLLEDHQGHWEVVAETGDGGEAVRLAEAYRPDVAIVDFSMPVLNGVEAVRRIVERSPTTRVIMLCDYGDAAYLEHARSAGAVGFVVTDAAVMDLLAAVGEVLQGKSFTSPVLDTHRRRFTA